MLHQSVPTAMSFGETVLWFLVGMLISIVFPVILKTFKLLRKKVGLEATPTLPSPTFLQRILTAWQQYGGNTYFGLLVLSILVVMVLVFMLGLQFYNPRDAAIAGFGWESLANKLFSVQQGEVQT